ncbi:MAG: hypothetical protein WAT39_14770 [Planctomycetota bacterium]
MTHFRPDDGSSWPMPRPEIEGALRYGATLSLTMQQQTSAASILAAYEALLRLPSKHVRLVQKAWRAAQKKEVGK